MVKAKGGAAMAQMVYGVNPGAQPGNLPMPLSTFIGRQRQIPELTALLAEHRLLTLTGPGGSGKTRLALRVAREVQPRYRDGVWLVEFASLGEEHLVPQAVASALGAQERAGTTVADALVEYLAPRSLLLVLDNCEHLVGAVAELAAALLRGCEGLRILTTSREPLGVNGEIGWVVPPLSVPAPHPWRNPDRVREALAAYEQAEAVQLFMTRAREFTTTFEMTPEDAPWVADICRRLDGIPLAIELAAARVRMLSVRQIAERLENRSELLRSRLRTAPSRHRSLDAVLDWSYELLSPPEQEMLGRLTVFSGGWTLEAAEAVCVGDSISPVAVEHLLSNLVDKSLVLVDQSEGAVRYRFLETIRQYAQEKPGEAATSSGMRNRHLAYFLRWAESATPRLLGPDQARWSEHFEAEHDNLRAALEWGAAAEDGVSDAMCLAVACARFWHVRSYLSEGRLRLAALLRLDNTQAPSLVRAWALMWAGNLAYLQADYAASRAWVEEGLAIAKGLGRPGLSVLAKGLQLLGELATEAGDYEAGVPLLQEGLATYRVLDEKRGIADMLMQLGWAAMRSGHLEHADELLNESLPLCRELNEGFLLGLILAGLGELAMRRGRLDSATELLDESLAIRRKIGDRWGVASALGSLGWIALLRRELALMRRLLGESLDIRLELGDQGGTAWCLEKLGQTIVIEASTLPRPLRKTALERAARVFGAAAALRALVGSVIDPADRPDHERLIAELRGVTGEKPFFDAWTLGQSLPMDKIVELSMSPVVTERDANTLSTANAVKSRFGGLTSREREVAALIVAGKTNREIAEAMVLGNRTVETYVTRILNKLGFDSRVRIATWGMEIGLGKGHAEES